MEAIICSMAGIFIGLTTSWYFQIKPIKEKNDKISQLEYENFDLRNICEDAKEDKRYLEKQLKKIKNIVDDYDTANGKVTKIKEVIQGTNLK